MEIGFIPVTKENIAEAERLAVAPAQAGMVETVAECWAEALEFPLWRPVVLAADGVWVGFAMYGAWPRESGGADVWLDRFFIDARYQGRGLSKRFLPVLMRSCLLACTRATAWRRACTRNLALPSTAGSISTAKR